MFVHELLRQSVGGHAEREALVAGELRLSYAELGRRVQRLASVFRERGIARGERVAIDLGNDPLAVIAIWATLEAGGAFVCLDLSTPHDRFAELLADFRPRLLLTRPERLAELPASARPAETLCREEAETATLGPDPADPPGAPVGEAGEQLANLVYTSGSTGRPKGVMMTHASMGAAIDAITSYLRASHEDRTLCLLPLSFDYGLYQVLMTGAKGGCVVLEPGFGYPGEVLARLRDERITTLPCVPTLFALLLRMKSFREEEFPALHTLTNTGAGVPVPHVLQLRERFPHVRLYLMYGLTECKRVSYLPPEETDRRPDSVGIAMPHCEVAVVDADGRRLPAGQEGELVVRGRNLMAGYWERPEATAEMLRPGPWPGERCLWTGDVFRMDEDGFLYFVARRDDVFKSRGEKVAPSEVEEVLHRMEAVSEAAVVGVEDPVQGLRVRAVVVPAPGVELKPSAVKRWCSTRLESFKVPQEVLVVERLPRNARGKVDRGALRALEPQPQGGPA